jgi:hypothetical protein
MWEASLENAKQPSFGTCSIRSIWLQVPSFPRARPRLCRREGFGFALLLSTFSATYIHVRTVLCFRFLNFSR